MNTVEILEYINKKKDSKRIFIIPSPREKHWKYLKVYLLFLSLQGCNDFNILQKCDYNLHIVF